MAISPQAAVNERGYFCRLQLQAYRLLLDQQSAPRQVVERAIGESVLFHLRQLYRCYLQELAAVYQGPARDYLDLADVVSTLGRQGVVAAEFVQLQQLEADSDSWLAQILLDDDVVAPQPVRQSSVIKLRQLDSRQDVFALDGLQLMFAQLQALIDQQRGQLQEW